MIRISAITIVAATALAAIAGAGCDVNATLEQVSDARHRSADLLVQFTKAADAANKAVMADTDDASVAFAREAEQQKASVQANVDALGTLLQTLQFSEETRVLQDFTVRFAEYRELDRRILDLAVENTNLKAQRISYGPAQQAVDAFAAALNGVKPGPVTLMDAAKDTWRARALAATAVSAVREIQVMQAPHIADLDDSAMARMEERMAASEAEAKSALQTLSALVQPASRAQISTATEALDRFLILNAQIVALSRRNTNVRSLRCR